MSFVALSADQSVDLGLLVSGDGNNFHGDPDIYKTASPKLRYTMLTVVPSARIHLSCWAHLNIEGEIIVLYRFEFFDSDDEVASYDLKPSQYIRVGLQYGG